MNKKSDNLTLAAFFVIVLFIGVNFVAVRFSNRELAPFWGAALRFVTASILLFAFVKVKKLSLPKGRALLGASLFGLLAFGVNFGLLYWALLSVNAGTASVVFATIPLTTILVAAAVGLEKLHWKGILGASIVIAGIGIVFNEQLKFNAPLISLMAVFLASIAAALSGVVVKYFPKSHPISTNAVGMATGAVVLFFVSLMAHETFRLPSLTPTWIALVWLITSSIVAFVLMVWVISRWTASSAAYTAVLAPLVTVITASLLAGEAITLTFLTGALLVLLGVYTGALSSRA